MQKMMFNDKYGLTEAVLDGSKRMTRRICKVQRPSDEWRIVLPIIEQLINPECLPYAYAWRNDKTEEYTDWCVPRYKVGEIVAVAQNYKDILNAENVPPFLYQIYTLGNVQSMRKLKGFDNKMFVRADLMPHQIQITNIRLERLQDISDEDCIAEGIMRSELSLTSENISVFYYINEKRPIRYWSYREAYAALIDKISGKGTWESNPYVFVYEFKLIK